MRKIVVNRCYGGFGLSKEAMLHYAARKGITLYPERDGIFDGYTYYTVPADQRVKPLDGGWQSHSLEVRAEYNKMYSSQRLYDRDIKRDDPDLVLTVEALGSERASDRFAALEVVEIPEDVEWEIDEYDGMEHVEERHRSW